MPCICVTLALATIALQSQSHLHTHTAKALLDEFLTNGFISASPDLNSAAFGIILDLIYLGILLTCHGFQHVDGAGKVPFNEFQKIIHMFLVLEQCH